MLPIRVKKHSLVQDVRAFTKQRPCLTWREILEIWRRVGRREVLARIVVVLQAVFVRTANWLWIGPLISTRQIAPISGIEKLKVSDGMPGLYVPFRRTIHPAVFWRVTPENVRFGSVACEATNLMS